MRFFRLLPAALLLSLAPLAMADLTVDQKVSDFTQLAAQYAKNYAPYELKRDFFGFDLYATQPWLDQVKASKSDLEFFDICVKYVASLQDSHDEFFILSDFDAWLHFDGDLYDGKLLIDYIDRTHLATARFGFKIGDELVTVDGVPVADLIKQFRPYSFNGSSNPTSRDRLAAATITERYQAAYPLAINIGKSAVIEVKAAATGVIASYTVPWDVSGTPVTTAGLLRSPATRKGPKESAFKRPGKFTAALPYYRRGMESTNARFDNPWGVRQDSTDPAPEADATPAYLAPLAKLGNFSSHSKAAVFTDAKHNQASGLNPFGNIFPVFNPPAGFVTRRGLSRADYFLSGTFPSGTLKIGYIRIPDMAPASTTTALTQYAAEIAYFQANTDGLVIDVMANGGGSVCYTQTLVGYLMPNGFRAAAGELRASLGWQLDFSSVVTQAQQLGLPPYYAALYNQYLTDIKTALTQNRARTGSLPFCGISFDAPAAKDTKGNNLAYTKPIVVVTDNFTLSAGEIFTMMLQDEGRAKIFGTRTDGGGGNVVEFPNATAFSEGDIRITESIITRKQPYNYPGFGTSNYYDGFGIFPDIEQDYQTASNLSTGGVPFVTAITKAITDQIAVPKTP